MNKKTRSESEIAEFFVRKFGNNLAETEFALRKSEYKADINLVIYFIRDAVGDLNGAISAISNSNLSTSNESSYRYLRGTSFFKMEFYENAFQEFCALEGIETKIGSVYFLDEARALAAISAKKIGKLDQYDRLKKLVPYGHLVYLGFGAPVRFSEF